MCSSNTFAFLLLESLTAALAVLDITAQTENFFKLTTILSFWIGLCYLIFFLFIIVCLYVSVRDICEFTCYGPQVAVRTNLWSQFSPFIHP